MYSHAHPHNPPPPPASAVVAVIVSACPLGQAFRDVSSGGYDVFLFVTKSGY